MQTQKDHVHAYQFMMDRMGTALVRGDTGGAEIHSGRAVTGLAIGVVVTLLVGTGFWVYGLLVPSGSEAWREPGTIVVEEETGSRFVYTGTELVPVFDHASALLMTGGGELVVTSRESLSDVPRAEPAGIPDAPDPVPTGADVAQGAWQTCVPTSAEPGAGTYTDLTPGTDEPPGPEWYVLVASPDERYVVWEGRKYKLSAQAAAVLGLVGESLPRAPEAWLDDLPDGLDIAPAKVRGAGDPGPEIDGRTLEVGQPVRQSGGPGFVVLEDGLAPVDDLEMALLSAVRDAATVDVGAVAAAPASQDRSLIDRIPDLLSLRRLAEPDAALCVRHDRGQDTVVASRQADPAGPVAVATNRGRLVVRAEASADRTAIVYLVTDRGVRYPLDDASSVKAFGLENIEPLGLPTPVLEAMPLGPALGTAELKVLPWGRP